MKRKALMVALVLLLIGYVASLMPISLSANTRQAIVRLTTIDGQFFCTGYMVAPRVVVTAAHCVIDNPTQIIMVQTHDGHNAALAQVVRMAPQGDLAVLMLAAPSAKLNQTLSLVQDAESLNSAWTDMFTLKMACGFPYGGELTCTRVWGASRFTFSWRAYGYLYPGMSGGPVMDRWTNEAIGVNTAAFDDGTILLSPTVEVLHGL